MYLLKILNWVTSIRNTELEIKMTEFADLCGLRYDYQLFITEYNQSELEPDMNKLLSAGLALAALAGMSSHSAHANPYYMTVQPITHSEASRIGDRVITLTDYHGISKGSVPATVLSYDPDISYVQAPDYVSVEKSSVYGGFYSNGGYEYSMVLSANPRYAPGALHQAAYALDLKPGQAIVVHLDKKDFLVTPGAYKKI